MSLTSVSSNQGLSPCEQYQELSGQLSERLQNPDLSTDQKFSLVARGFMSGSEIVGNTEKLAKRNVKKIDILKEENVKRKEENIELKEENDVLKKEIAEDKVKYNELKKQQYIIRAEPKINKLKFARDSAIAGRIGLNALGIATAPLVVGAAGIICAEALVVPEIEEMKGEIWLLERFPESLDSKVVKEEAQKVFNKAYVKNKEKAESIAHKSADLCDRSHPLGPFDRAEVQRLDRLAKAIMDNLDNNLEKSALELDKKVQKWVYDN